MRIPNNFYIQATTINKKDNRSLKSHKPTEKCWLITAEFYLIRGTETSSERVNNLFYVRSSLPQK
jgi:hypothetical protein